MAWMVSVPPPEIPGGFEAEEARRALSALADLEQMVGLRGLRAGKDKSARNILLPGSKLEHLLVEATAWHRTGRTAYFNINPVKNGTVREDNQGPLVEHIARRRWLMVDVDPARAADAADSPATDAEKALAGTVRDEVRAGLARRGWPEPVVIDSGNGWHLLYRIDLPNDEKATELVKSVLATLAKWYDCPAGSVDQRCFDATRICKLPGSLARKGTHTAARPYRPCRLVELPAKLEVVGEADLVELAGVQASEPTDRVRLPEPARPKPAPDGSWRLPSGHRGADPESRAVAYLSSCPPAVSGQGGHGITFYVARALVWGFNLSRDTALSLLKSHYNPGCRPEWSDSELAHKVKEADEKPFSKDRGWLLNEKDPRFSGQEYEQARDKAQKQTQQKQAQQKQGPPKLATWAFHYDGEVIDQGRPDELMQRHDGGGDDDEEQVRVFELCTLGNIIDKTYPEPKWIIPGIMSEGLNILAGAPKQGKSMMALNLAMTVAGGGMALGNIEVPAYDVLYLSLEDKQRRVKSRALKMLPAIGEHMADNIRRRLTVATDWPKQDENGLKFIDIWAKRCAHPGLLIVDVWNRFCPAQRTNGNAYNHDAEAMSEVKRFVEKRGITALVVHHTRKPGMKEPEDFVHEISGTMGLSGTADGIMVLVRHRQDSKAELHVTGRDVTEQQLILEFDVLSLTWKSIGTAEQHVGGQVQTKVITYLRGLGEVGAFTNDIAEAIEEKPDSVRKALGRLQKEKIIRKKGNCWMYPGDEPCGDELSL